MADVAEDLEGEVEAELEAEVEAEVELEAEAESYSVLVEFVMDSSVSEAAALNFLERVKGHYGFTYGPYHGLVFNWNDKNLTKRKMARIYRISGLPTEGEAVKFVAELVGKKGIDRAYREPTLEIDDDDPYLNTGVDINDKIEKLMRG